MPPLEIIFLAGLFCVCLVLVFASSYAPTFKEYFNALISLFATAAGVFLGVYLTNFYKDSDERDVVVNLIQYHALTEGTIEYSRVDFYVNYWKGVENNGTLKETDNIFKSILDEDVKEEYKRMNDENLQLLYSLPAFDRLLNSETVARHWSADLTSTLSKHKLLKVRTFSVLADKDITNTIRVLALSEYNENLKLTWIKLCQKGLSLKVLYRDDPIPSCNIEDSVRALGPG
jgi:hypothetical protein